MSVSHHAVRPRKALRWTPYLQCRQLLSDTGRAAQPDAGVASGMGDGGCGLRIGAALSPHEEGSTADSSGRLLAPLLGDRRVKTHLLPHNRHHPSTTPSVIDRPGTQCTPLALGRGPPKKPHHAYSCMPNVECLHRPRTSSQQPCIRKPARTPAGTRQGS